MVTMKEKSNNTKPDLGTFLARRSRGSQDNYQKLLMNLLEKGNVQSVVDLSEVWSIDTDLKEAIEAILLFKKIKAIAQTDSSLLSTDNSTTIFESVKGDTTAVHKPVDAPSNETDGEEEEQEEKQKNGVSKTRKAKR